MWIGADGGNRTHNLFVTNELLCRLSYTSILVVGGLRAGGRLLSKEKRREMKPAGWVERRLVIAAGVEPASVACERGTALPLCYAIMFCVLKN